MRKLYLPILLGVLCVVCNSITAQVVFNESGGGAFPSGWVGVNNVTSQPLDKGSYWLVEPAGTPDYITTATYDLSANTSATFAVNIRSFSSGSHNSLHVEVSTDGGSSWTQSYSTPITTTSYTTRTVTITSVSNQVVVRLSSNGTSGRSIRMRNLILTGVGTSSTDTEAEFTTASGSVAETAGSHSLPFSITQPSSSATTDITVELTGGDPSFTDDFASLGSTITVNAPAGATTHNFSLDINDNASCDGSETLIFEITAVSGGQGIPTIGSTDTYALTITDDEQTSGVIAFQGFETGDTWGYSLSGTGGTSATNTGTPSGERIRTGTTSYQAANSSNGRITLDNGGSGLNIAAASNVTVDVYTASISATSGNGIDAGDNIRVYVSQTSVFSATPDIQVNGASNCRYGMSGTGDVSTTAGTPSTYTYPSGGSKTGNDAKTRLSVDIPDSWNNLFVKVEVQNNSSSEIWCVDDVTVSADQCTTTPLITVNPTTLNPFGDVCTGDVSAVQSYDVTGTNLTADILISAPSGFEIRTGAAAYSSSVTLTQLSGNVATTTIDVRFAPGSVATFSGNLEHTSAGALQVDIAVTGNGVDTPGSVTTTAASSISFNSASSGGNGTEGCNAITSRGVVFDTSPSPTINPTADGTGAGSYTSALTGLSSNTTYYYRAYVIDATGTYYGNELSFTTLKDEPTNHPTSFNCGTTTSSSIPLTWLDATGGTLPDGYLIKWSSTSFAAITDPVDGTAESNGATTQNVTQGTQNYTATGLLASTTYYFKIYAYTNSGSNINYKLTATIPQTSCATIAGPCLATDFSDADGWVNHSYGNWSETDINGTWQANDTYAGPNSATRRIQMNDVGDWLQLPNVDNPSSLEYYASLSSSPSGSNRTKVQYFNGTVWVDIVEHTCTTTSYALFTADLSSLTAQTGVQLRLYRSADDRTQYIDDVAVYCGTGCTPPATQATAASAINPTSSTIDISWTAGSGTNSIVVIKEAAAVTNNPNSGTVYTASTTFGSGSDIGSNEYVIYNGTGTSVTVDGLNIGTTYHVAVFSFDLAGNCYNGLGAATANQTTTCGSTPNDVTNAAAIFAEGGEVILSWDNPTNCWDNVLIFASENACTGNTPTGNGALYSPASTVFGSGDDDLEPGAAYLVYKGTDTTVNVTNLNNGQQYCFIIFVREDTNWSTGIEVTVTPDYCTAGSTDDGFEFIQGVEFADISNTSSFSTYTDFTALSSDIERGETYPLTVFVGDYYPEDSCLVWIDWDGDGIFADPGERVMASYGSAPFTTNVTIPLTATLGSTRMRIRLYDELLGTQNDTPCGTHTYGEVEDYTVNIIDPCIPVHSVTSYVPTSGPKGTDVTITGTGFTASTTVNFNGVAASFVTFVNSTTLIAEAPDSTTTGPIEVIEFACDVETADFTIIDENGQCASATSFTDIFISEVFDGEAGNAFYIELFNPNATDIDLDAIATDYIIKIDNRNSGTPGITIDRTIDLTGTIVAGETLVFNFGTRLDCPTNVVDITAGGNGINEWDYVFLAKNATDVDRVNLPGELGYSVSRNATANGPTTIYNAADWTVSSTEDCSDLGTGPVVFYPPPTVSDIADINGCDLDFSVTVTEGDNSVLNDLSYIWYFNDGTSATWSVVNNTNLPGFTITGNTSDNLVITGVTPSVTVLTGYQFYVEVTEAGACYKAGNAATYNAESDPFYRTAGSGNWNTVAVWETSPDGIGSWTPACLVPNASRARETRILLGHTVVITEDLGSTPDVSIDSLIIEEGGTLELQASAELHIENTTGIDFTVDGRLLDRANSGGGNGITFNGGATWTLGSDDTVRFTNTGGLLTYRDNYEGGISTIPSDAHWFFTYNGDGSVATLAVDMFYPNLYFESTAGNYDFDAFVEVFTGRLGFATVKGNMYVGNTGTGDVKVFTNNFSVDRMLILGNLNIGSGSEFTNEPYIAVPNGNYNFIYREGSGVDMQGGGNIDGTLDLTYFSSSATTPANAITAGNEGLLLGGLNAQNISGNGSLVTHNTVVNNPGNTTLGGIDLEVNDLLTFVDGKIITSLGLTEKVIVYNSSPAAIPGGATTGGQPTRYVQGLLQWRLNGSNTYIFPVGDDGTFGGSQPTSFTANGATNADVLTFSEGGAEPLLEPSAFCDIGQHPGGAGIPTANTCIGGPDGIMDFININLESPLQWSITLEGGSLGNYDVTVLPATAADVLAYNVNCGAYNTDLRWLMKNGEPGEMTPTTSNQPPFTGVSGFLACPNQYTLLGMTSFSKFRLHGAHVSNTLLPVELLYFNAVRSGSDAYLTWSTASEINNDFYDVQHSENGASFVTIGQVDGNGTTSEQHDYSFMHTDPLIGQNYYRLRIVDFNGDVEFSPIRVVQFEDDRTNDLEVVNTMAGDVVEVIVPNGGGRGGVLTIYAMNGQVVRQMEFIPDGIQSIRMNVADLPSAMYAIQWYDGFLPIEKKFIKY